MLSENEKKDLINKSKYDLHIKGKSEIKMNNLKILLKNNNYDYSFNTVTIYRTLYLIENVNKCYIIFNDLKQLNDFLNEIRTLKKENHNNNKYDYSKFNGNISFSDCENCINNFGKSENCLNCNYYKDCLIENEINDFENEQNEKLKNFYDLMENDFYRQY